MAKYHEIGRFKIDDEIDIDSALYHEQIAADLGVKEAILTMASLHLGLPRDVLSHVTVEVSILLIAIVVLNSVDYRKIPNKKTNL